MDTRSHMYFNPRSREESDVGTLLPPHTKRKLQSMLPRGEQPHSTQLLLHLLLLQSTLLRRERQQTGAAVIVVLHKLQSTLSRRERRIRETETAI